MVNADRNEESKVGSASSGRQVAAMFPGQGSQYVGMAKSLVETFSVAARVFEEMEDALHFSLRKLCFDGPESDLKITANTQPAILAASIAQWRVLVSEAGLNPVLFMGHSLGEYSALVASGRLTLANAATLVRQRGEAMQRAVPEGRGAMAAVLTCPGDTLSALCREHSSKGESVSIVNYNSPAQLVVAGHKGAVDRLLNALESQNFRFVVLQVSAPFHSPLMEPAKRAMAPLLKAAPLTENGTKLVPNLKGQVVTSYNVDYLIEQIDQPVLWLQSMQAAAAEGVELYVEVGPGKVLCGLAKRCLSRDTQVMAGDDTQATLKALAELHRKL